MYTAFLGGHTGPLRPHMQKTTAEREKYVFDILLDSAGNTFCKLFL